MKVLPPERLQQAATYVRQLREASQAERLGVLRATAGTLTAAEADNRASAIEDCERIDDSAW